MHNVPSDDISHLEPPPKYYLTPFHSTQFFDHNTASLKGLEIWLLLLEPKEYQMKL